MTDNVPTFGCQRSQFGLSGVRQRERPLKWQQGKLKSFYRVFVHDGFFIIIVCCHCNKIRTNTLPFGNGRKMKRKMFYMTLYGLREKAIIESKELPSSLVRKVGEKLIKMEDTVRDNSRLKIKDSS